MAANALAEESEIANDIEDFVAHEFVRKAQRFLAQHRVAADDDRVLEAAALDQILVHERLHIFVKNEGAGGRDLLLVDGRRYFGGKKLGKLPVRSRLRAGDAELRIGHYD